MMEAEDYSTEQTGDSDSDEGDGSTYSQTESLLIKVQTADKDWDNAPIELIELQALLLKAGYEAPWTPKKLGINLLTANKIRGMVLKRILEKIYPFLNFWTTDTLDETLHKCFLVCQQLSLESDWTVVWGNCSMDISYEFWKTVLKAVPKMTNSRSEHDCLNEARAKVISALMASRGTDWDKMIARNFENTIGKNRSSVLLKRCSSVLGLPQKLNSKSGFNQSNNWSESFPHVRKQQDDEEPSEYKIEDKILTTTSFATELKEESYEMIEILKNLEAYYSNDSVLQIEKAFNLGYNVCELADEFEGYMTANNRGAFKDVDALAHHTDKVIKGMSKLTMAYKEFFHEFRKYFDIGQGDEVVFSATQSHPIKNFRGRQN